MFNLEEQISAWRKQMLAAGIKTPALLEELELHLREDVEQQVRPGLSGEEAFAATVQDVGRPETLKLEFAKVRETVYERLLRLLRKISGIPDYQPITNMNTTNQSLEPRWATYLKAAANSLPAFFFWGGFCIFVLPKLIEVCHVAGVRMPGAIILALTASHLLKDNFILFSAAVGITLAMLEWRSNLWARYRRLVLGTAVYGVNVLAFLWISLMAVLAVLAGSQLLPGK